MKVISTKTHGVLDYIVGLLLIASPWIFSFNREGAEKWVPIILGAGTIMYSLLTDYELGAISVIRMKSHLVIDAAAGIFLAASPWLFGFANFVWEPHLIIGLMELVVVALSKSQTSVEKRREGTRGFTTAH